MIVVVSAGWVVLSCMVLVVKVDAIRFWGLGFLILALLVFVGISGLVCGWVWLRVGCCDCLVLCC